MSTYQWNLAIQITVGAIKSDQYTRQRRRRDRSRAVFTSSSSSSGSPSNTSSGTRHVKWPAHKISKYTLIRKGLVLDELDIEEMWGKGTLTEEMLWHFKHTDQYVTRTDKTEPKYVSVFRCGDYYIRPQQKYLKAIYKQDDRLESKRAWEIMKDGTPYWTDLYAIRIQKEQESKKRYQIRKRKKELEAMTSGPAEKKIRIK